MYGQVDRQPNESCCEVSSNHSNDYFFMWQRDAAMSMRSLLRVIVDAPNRTFASSMSTLAAIGVLGVIMCDLN
jgi:GH15 family glucan-1,4-alpha-glucosidase